MDGWMRARQTATGDGRAMSTDAEVAKTNDGALKTTTTTRATRRDANERPIDARAPLQSSFETTTDAADDQARPSQDDDARAADSAKTYLESTVASALHDGMMALNAARPADPLRFLGEFLVRRADADAAAADA